MAFSFFLKRIASVLMLAASGLTMLGVAAHAALAQGKVLNAVFTPTPIKVDGVVEDDWNRAAPQHISIGMSARLTA